MWGGGRLQIREVGLGLESVSLIVLCCFSQVRYDVDDDTVNYENIRSPDGV